MQPLYCPFPCQIRAVLINNNIKTKLQESLEYLIEVNKNELGDYYDAWKHSLSPIQTDKKISSYYYSLNSLLVRESLTGVAGNVTAIARYINALPKKLSSVGVPISNNHNLHFLNFEENNLQTEDLNRFKVQKKYILFDLPFNADIHTPDDISADKIKTLVIEAIELIAHIDKDYYQEMSELLSEILILKSEFLKAGSSFDLLGMVYISTSNAKQSLINMVDLLIHESAHYYLYGLSVDDPLVLNDYSERYFSPIKGKERPMIGVYHAAFVLFRVLKFLSLFRESSKTSLNSLITDSYNMHKNEIAELKVKYSQIVRESLETVMKFGELTELGSKLIKATEKEFVALTKN